MYEKMDGLIYGKMNGWIDVWMWREDKMDGQLNGELKECMERWN